MVVWLRGDIHLRPTPPGPSKKVIQRKKNTIYLTYTWNQKNKTLNHRYRQQVDGCQEQVVMWRGGWEMSEGGQRYKLPVVTLISSEDVIYKHRDYS